jgi:hypothetical protein
LFIHWFRKRSASTFGLDNFMEMAMSLVLKKMPRHGVEEARHKMRSGRPP